MNAVYWLSFALLCVYLAIMVVAYREARPLRRRRSSLACRLAPYRGGWLPRTPPAADAGGELIEFPSQYSVKVGDAA